MKRNVVVLGGTGFIGTKVLASLSVDPQVNLSWVKRVGSGVPDIPNLPAPVLIEDLESIDLSWISKADVVIDLVSRGRGRMIQSRDINLRVRPHFRIIDGLINNKSKAHYITLSSGGALYGNTDSQLLTESSLFFPQTEYGLEKAMIEMHLLYAAQTTLEVSILRVSNAYGVGQVMKPGFGVIPALVNALQTKSAFQIFGSGGMQRDYVNVSDVQRAVISAMRLGGVGVVNIGTGKGTSINDLVTLVSELSPYALNVEKIESGNDDPDFTQLDISRAKNVLDWEPAVSLRDGLKQILEEANLLKA